MLAVYLYGPYIIIDSLDCTLRKNGAWRHECDDADLIMHRIEFFMYQVVAMGCILTLKVIVN